MINAENVKISVVMPIYNADDYLKPAIDGVLGQTLKGIELICVDDGSTDKSLSIIKEYQQADERVRILTESNAGPSIARNKGLARARGKYVIFLDADDFYESTLLEKLYDMAEEKSLDIAVCKFDIYNNRKAKFEDNIRSDHGEIFNENDVVSKNDYPDVILSSTTGYIWNKLFRREFLTEKELVFDPDLRVFEDTHFVVTALSLADKVGKCHEKLIHHRVYTNQPRNKLFKKYYGQVPVVYAKIKEFLRAHGMYTPLSQSFLNLSASRCYKIYNLLWLDAKGEFWNMLHESYAEEIGWTRAEPEYFESDEVRDFVASILMYTHKQQLKRQERGLKVKVKSVGRAIKAIQLRKRAKAFLDKIRGKGKDKSEF
jgi:glycosyltransferase involved in cell wall biosynthesis